jgi:hypothetical protein
LVRLIPAHETQFVPDFFSPAVRAGTRQAPAFHAVAADLIQHGAAGAISRKRYYGLNDLFGRKGLWIVCHDRRGKRHKGQRDCYCYRHER